MAENETKNTNLNEGAIKAPPTSAKPPKQVKTTVKKIRLLQDRNYFGVNHKKDDLLDIASYEGQPFREASNRMVHNDKLIAELVDVEVK